MHDSTYVRAEFVDGVLVAVLKSEKVGEYESQVISAEIKGLLAKGKPRLVVDMSPVMLLSSAGIGMLMDLYRTCQGGGGRFSICSLDEDVHGSLRITKMDRLFNIKADRAGALAGMA